MTRVHLFDQQGNRFVQVLVVDLRKEPPEHGHAEAFCLQKAYTAGSGLCVGRQTRMIYAFIEARKDHFLETSEGLLLVYTDLLLKYR